MIFDIALKEWATETQARYVDAVNEHGGIRQAARALGDISHQAIGHSLRRLRARAAAQGFSPEHGLNHAIPFPFVAKGHSTLDKIDRDTGARTQVLQWTKTRLDDQRYLQLVQDAIQGFLADVPPLPIIPAPRDFERDIIPWINIGDAHIGLLTHAAEVGENFDLKIAKRELLTAVMMLIDELPQCERLVINDLGDATHYENFAATTEASGHALDHDTRFPKMIRVYSEIMRAIVDRALTRARYVDVIINQGNHSRTNDIWMAELLRVAYGNSDRVNVLNNDSVFIGYRMGKTFVMTHHSDKCRHKDLIGVLTTDFREDFGETEYHYIDTGHIHHAMAMKEHGSVVIESFNHLPATDKWAHENGYRNRKSITTVWRSKTYGEVGRRLLPIQQIRDRIGLSAPARVRPFTV